MATAMCDGCKYEKPTVETRVWQYEDSLIQQYADLCDECAALCVYCSYDPCICEEED